MRVGWGPALLLTGLLAVSGCTGSGSEEDPGALEPEESAPTLGAFATAVNTRCEKLADDAVKVTGGEEPKVAKFNADQSALTKLTAAFDAEIAKLPTETEEDRRAASTFAAFQRFSDTAYAKVLTAAKANDQASFDTAFEAFLSAFESAPEQAALDEVAISCPAR